MNIVDRFYKEGTNALQTLEQSLRELKGIIKKPRLINYYHGSGCLWSDNYYEVLPALYLKHNLFSKANIEGFNGTPVEQAEFYVVIKKNYYKSNSHDVHMFTNNWEGEITACNDVLYKSSNFDECINWCIEQGVK